MNTPQYTLHLDRNLQADEFGRLASLAHWGEPGDFTQERLAAHFAAVDFVAHVRDAGGFLVGYVSAISNGLGAVYLDALLVHPEYERERVGRLLLRAMLKHFQNQPVYAMPFVDEEEVFRSEGFKVYRREMIALANRNDVPTAGDLTTVDPEGIKAG
ncbi:MAG TPA: GNAT family N-acetyltransferase [Chthoniobacteraceae bacterium]|nr:GNAT family N-acetyltransferase [Chthoniobacteraceae bacterium]